MNDINTNGITLSEWLHEWFEVYSRPNVKPATAVLYEGYIRNHYVPYFGDMPIEDIKLYHLQSFFNSEAEKYSPKTVRNVRNTLHKVFQTAISCDILSKNYVEFVKIPKVKTPVMRVFTIEEETRIIKQLRLTDEQYAIGIFLCLMTGIRVGELCGLQWKHIDLAEQELRIRQTLQRLPKLDYNGFGNKTEVLIGSPKSDDSIREIPLDKVTMQKILEYRAYKIEMYGVAVVDSEEFFLAPSVGNFTEPRTMQDAFKRILDAAHIKDANFHALRHTFATRALEAGVDFKTLSVLLGHSDINVTMNRYAHVLKEHKMAAMKSITEAILSSY